MIALVLRQTVVQRGRQVPLQVEGAKPEVFVSNQMCVLNQNIATGETSCIFWKPRANLCLWKCAGVDHVGPNLTGPYLHRAPKRCCWWGEGWCNLGLVIFPNNAAETPLSILSCFKLFLFQIVSLNWTKHAKNISQKPRLKLTCHDYFKHFEECQGKFQS